MMRKKNRKGIKSEEWMRHKKETVEGYFLILG